MHEWNATTMRMAKPRRLLRARLDLVMLPTAIAFPHTGKLARDIAASRDSEGPAAFFGGCHYALIRRPYNACLPGSGGELAFNGNKAGLIAALTGLAYGVAARMGGHSHNR